MKKEILTLLFAISFLTGCEDLDIAPGVPNCLEDKIKTLKKTSPCDTGNSVREFSFQDETVYVLSPGNCLRDGSAEVIDSDCNTLGKLGGLAGNDEINGVVFHTNATFVRTVWED